MSSRDTTDCININGSGTRQFTIEPSDYFKPFDMPVVSNAADAKELFLGGLEGSLREIASIFALNAALALRTMNRCGLKEGYGLAYEAIMNGSVRRKLDEMKLGRQG